VVVRHAIHLRLTPPDNNQPACINLADRFAFDGAIAQLGERRHGMAEVVGSSPTSSTPPSAIAEGAPITVGSNPFRDQLVYWMEVAEAHATAGSEAAHKIAALGRF
jgi:hypothetical protein